MESIRESIVDSIAQRFEADRQSLVRALTEVARRIAPHAGPATREALVRSVGEAMLRDAPREPDDDRQSLVDRVAQQCAVGGGAAIELVQSTLLALTRALGPEAAQRLHRELPPSWVEWLDDPHAVQGDRRGAAPRVVAAGEGTTLATGRPGGARPLADASAPAGHGESIAGSDQPHAGRTLATSQGTPDRAVASGRPPRGGREDR
ncbi:MAG: DUF2267 domain-containing protein [Nannocystaceae bacterium]|nr:DUF2267 domain-containing protein [Nannocystaceae bacterium]